MATKRTRIPVEPGRYTYYPDYLEWFMTDMVSAPAHVEFIGGYATATINCTPCQVDLLNGDWEYLGPWVNPLEEEEDA